MKKNFIFKSMLMIALICVSFVCPSCSDDESDTVIYSMGFSLASYSGSGESVMFEEMGQIESAFTNALGVEDMTFAMEGSISSCDSKVLDACRRAEQSLNGVDFVGSYIFDVTNNNSNKKVYTFSTK